MDFSCNFIADKKLLPLRSLQKQIDETCMIGYKDKGATKTSHLLFLLFSFMPFMVQFY